MSFSFEVPRASRLEYLKKSTNISDVSGLKILDWGGNTGNLLMDGIEIGEINPADYTCIDVDASVMENSAEKFPLAKWITRPVAHPVYACHDEQEDIDFTPHLNQYDVIFAYSVYTHDIWEKMIEDIDTMYSLLKPGGKICISYIGPDSAHVFRQKRINEYGHTVEPEAFAAIDDWCYFINNDILTKSYDRENECKYFISIFNHDWIKSLIESRWGECDSHIPDLNKIQDFQTEAWQPSITITKAEQ